MYKITVTNSCELRSWARIVPFYRARSCEMSCKPLRTYKRASAAFSGRDYRDYYRTAHFFPARITHMEEEEEEEEKEEEKDDDAITL